MKNRLKHMSKTTISVLLSLLMVVSTITVGIVATNAAYTEDDTVGAKDDSESVGWTTSRWLMIKGAWDNWADHWVNPDDGLEIDLSSYSAGSNVNFNICFKETDDGSLYYFTDQANIYTSNGSNFTWDGANNTTDSTLSGHFNVASPCKITIELKWSGQSPYLGITNVETVSNGWYIIGHQFDSGWNTSSKNCKMTLDSSTGYYYYEKSFTSGDNYYRIHDGSKQYQPDNQNEITLGTQYTLSEGSAIAVNIPSTLTGTHRVWWDATNKKTWVQATNKTVTYGVCTNQSTMGSVTATSGGTSIGDSPASVASGSSVVFTATPNFGYELEGWYTDADCTEGKTTTNPLTVTASDNITRYAKFKASDPDPYYLGGRFAVATQSANIHSSTINKNNVDQYGQTLNGGAGLDKSTASTTASSNYWSFVEGSTNLKFTIKDGSSTTVGEREYILNTYRTVKQLSEDKDKLLADYGGARDDYHNPFYFIIHDKVHRLGGTDSSGGNFQNQNSETNALTLSTYTGDVAESKEIRFNNYNSQSNGWVRIHLKENGYNPGTGTGGSPKIWYEIVDETPPAAENVRISATPARVDRNSSATTNVTLKGSYVGNPNASASSITYKFYKSTDGKTWTLLIDNGTTDTYSYKETSDASTMYYKVVVGSNTTTEGGKNYDTRSATTSVEIYSSGLYMSSHISGNTTPTWSSDLKAYAGYDYPYKQSTSASYTNSNPYVFTLSTITGWDPDMPKYTIDEASNQFCTIEYDIKDVTIDDEHASVVTYKVIPNPNCNNPRIYVDFKNKKVWAIATYNPSAKGTINNYGSEKVTYYFAERVADMSKSNPNGISYSNNEGMRIHYWNNSNPGSLNGDVNITTKVVRSGKNSSGSTTNTNSIWVDTSALYHKDNALSGKSEFKVYSVQLPIWATSFQFRTGNNETFNAVPTNVNDNYIADHSITLNPNRIYCLFNNATGDNWRVKGVILDESMWDAKRTTSANEVKTYKVDTNIINYTDNNTLQNPDKPNWALNSAYTAYDTPWSLYFGYFSTSNSTINSGQDGISNDYNSWGSPLFNFAKDSKTQWAANLAQRNNDKSYYAAVQDLVGMTTSKTQFNSNGDGSTFGYLLDTRTNDETSLTSSTLGKSTSRNMPLFAYAGDGTRNALSSYSSTTGENHNTTTTVAEGKKFPFYESTLNGITTYSYDSTTDRNRVYSDGNFSVQASSNLNGFATGKDADGHQYVGLFPFGGNNDSYGNCGFGLEYDLNFYMTNTGYLTDANGNAQDISFNFSGDDDVWVFVDGVKVLDLGGTHKVSAATINFTDGKVYYKSSAASIDSSVVSNGGVKGTWASDNNSYINVVDLNELLAAYGKPFNSTDASTKHTFQMFYLERGAFQSNCVISFNLPQASGLNIKNNITVDSVNPVLQKDTLFATNPDYFTYSLSGRLVNGDLPTSISEQAKTPAASAAGLDFSKPLFPYAYETKRVYDDGSNPIVTYVLSTGEGSGSPSSSLTYNNSSWTDANNTVYELSDEYLTATTEGRAQVTGKTGASGGTFHLLGGQMATFNDKLPQNAYVKVAQTQGLGTVNNSSPISYKPIENNETGNYYISSYSIYDEKSKKYIVSKTPFGIDLTNDHYAKDARLDSTDGANGFYFSNYTGDSEDINSAMRVDFYNDVAVGTIRIEKELDDLSFSDAKFHFKVKLGRLFGSGSEALKEYPGLEYKLYNSDGTLIGTRYYNANSGIVLTPGQYADIDGVPVETYYEVEEVPAAGYSFVSMTKTATKQNGTDIYYKNTVSQDNKYSEYVTGTPKSTNHIIATEGSGDDEFHIYTNMIPPVEETVCTIYNEKKYESLNKLYFVNQRETFNITFKYYDRDVTNNVPASISNVVSSYSVTLKNLDEYIYNKGQSIRTEYEYLSKLPGIDAVEDGAFVAYNYEKMIRDKAVEFVENTGTGVSNLIDDYRMWTRQDKAVTGLQTITNLKTRKPYSADDAVYHTTSNGQPNTSGDEKWVNYLSSEGTSLNPENPAGATADFHAGDLSNYENIKSIVVWLYNTPKEYTVKIYGANSTDDLNTAKDITLKGSGITVEGARVAKSSSSSSYTDVKGYYSQRLSNPMDDDYLDDIAYLKVYDVGSCVKQDNAYVCPHNKAVAAMDDLVFAYWAYDPEGTQVASTDYRYGYRITGNFNLYAVYAPARINGSQFGLTIVKDADDSYIDSAGNAKVRINTMFTPYNLVDNDQNIKRAAVVNIYVTKLYREGFNDTQIKALIEEYRDDLKDMLAANTFNPLSIINDNPSLNVELTTKGYVKLVNSGSSSIDLTNKNRIEFTTQFNKSQLYTDETVGIVQYGAMAYDTNGDGSVSANEWVLSDNSILRVFGN